jgi:hypothetical protein
MSVIAHKDLLHIADRVYGTAPNSDPVYFQTIDNGLKILLRQDLSFLLREKFKENASPLKVLNGLANTPEGKKGCVYIAMVPLSNARKDEGEQKKRLEDTPNLLKVVFAVGVASGHNDDRAVYSLYESAIKTGNISRIEEIDRYLPSKDDKDAQGLVTASYKYLPKPFEADAGPPF